MNSDNSRHCKIYVDTERDHRDLLALVSSLLASPSRFRSVFAPDGIVSVIKNEDADPSKQSNDDDGFIFYEYYLDVDSSEQPIRAVYIRMIANLLQGLWRSGCDAVTSCDFEDEPPERGGFRSPRQHRPK